MRGRCPTTMVPHTKANLDRVYFMEKENICGLVEASMMENLKEGTCMEMAFT